MSIKYRAGYKYQLVEPYEHQLDFTVGTPDGLGIITDFYELYPDGKLVVKSGYAYDGPSGPTFDTDNFMRGSLVHDVLYQCFREGHLDPKVYKEKADRHLQKICREDGMSAIRAWWVYQGLAIGGWPATQPYTNDVQTAGDY